MAHVCPWWLGYLLASPLRKLLQNPEAILAPWIREGMRVLELGPGMGFFSLPLARMVGPAGRLLCLDVQPRMLRALARRAAKAGLKERIETRLSAPDDLGLGDRPGEFDVALLFAVLHEIPDQASVWRQLARALKPEAQVLFAEPRGHVDAGRFEQSLSGAAAEGFATEQRPRVARSHAAVLRKV